MNMDDFEFEEYGENLVDDMMVDYDYHINSGDLPELFDESAGLCQNRRSLFL